MDFNLTQMPNKIKECSITDAIVELQFDSKVSVEEIISLILNKFKTENLKFEKLPIIQVPEIVRNNDPNFKFAALYKLIDDGFVFLIGPKSFSITCPKEYKGWTQYHQKIIKVFNDLKELDFIDKPINLGLRYINFFENVNVFEKIKINLSISGNSLINSENFLRSKFEKDGFDCIIQVANNAILNNKYKGSSIDIYITNGNNINLSKIADTINSAHEIEKNIFFGILTEDFLNSLEPEYL